jgi:hypothetical protein
VWNGSNWSCTACVSGLSGNASPTRSSQTGSVLSSVNIPERNVRATAVPMEAAWATPCGGASAERARPMAAKQAMPSSSVTTVAGTVRQTTCTPKASTPTAMLAVTEANAKTTAPPIRPRTSIQAGNGVPRSRLRTPCSRASAKEMATVG